jgi:hypothetical protein
MHYPAASPVVLFGIPVLAAFVGGLFVLGIARSERALGGSRRTALGRAALGAFGVGTWACVSLLLAARGVLSRFDARPPPFLLLLVLTLVGAVVLGRSRFGARLARGLPLWALVGFQTFRLPLELVLHRAARDGTMPVEMSFSGYNFDIVSGLTAAVAASALVISRTRTRFGLRAVGLWNLLGLLLLGNIVVIAVSATPVFHVFGPDHLNVWISEPPFVLLPSILVMAALLGHVLLFRKLQHLRSEVALLARATSSVSVSHKGSEGHPIATSSSKGTHTSANP